MTSTARTAMRAERSGPLRGSVRVPGDKSISHRALMLGALADGRTRITGLLEGEDVLGTASVLEALGARIERDGGAFVVHGRGLGGLSAPARDLDFGNSGTGTRLMMGIITGHPITARFTGDASLSRRPMGRVLKPLLRMGLEVAEVGREKLPLTLKGPHKPRAIEYALDVPSAQVKSAILLAGLHAPDRTTVVERAATRDHTERMLRHFGAEVEVVPDGSGARVTVEGGGSLRARDVTVPADPSSAAFLAAAALMVPGSDVVLEGVLVNPTRTGFYDTVREMGADIVLLDERSEGGEPVADLRVRYAPLKGIRVPAARAPSMIDEYPVLAALAAYAEGITRMEGLAELKVKESDRLAATAAGLLANGVAAAVDGDTLIVTGTGRVRGGGLVETHLDHRIAMAFLTMGLGAESAVAVDDVAMIATSFPEYMQLVDVLGGRLARSPGGAA